MLANSQEVKLPGKHGRTEREKHFALVRIASEAPCEEDPFPCPDIESALKELQLPVIGFVKRPGLEPFKVCFFTKLEDPKPHDSRAKWNEQVQEALNRVTTIGFNCKILGIW